MGWVKFKKISEHNEWVIYKYSYDCEDFDGIVKIRKVKNLTDNDVFITPSNSDKHKIFAFKVMGQVNKWLKNDEVLQERYILAYG